MKKVSKDTYHHTNLINRFLILDISHKYKFLYLLNILDIVKNTKQ